MRAQQQLIVMLAAILPLAPTAAAEPAKTRSTAPSAGSADKPIKGIWCGFKKNGEPVVGRSAAAVTGAGATPAPCPADATDPIKGAVSKGDQNPR